MTNFGLVQRFDVLGIPVSDLDNHLDSEYSIEMNPALYLRIRNSGFAPVLPNRF